MVLEELSSIAVGDLPLDAFKAHLRMGSGFADDAVQDEVLESYLQAAMAAIEARIGKMLFVRTVGWTFEEWAQSYAQPMPVAPVVAITSIELIDSEEIATLADPTTYLLRRDVHRPKIVAVGAALPTIPTLGKVRVVFDAGFGSSWADVPADLGHAVFLLAAHYYENRTDTSGAGGLMPFGVMALLEPHRNIRILGSGV